MKKPLAILIPLAFLISAASCSNNSGNPQQTPVSDNTAPSSAQAPVDTAAEGTNYTKGEFKEGYYLNEYAKLKMKLPSDALPSPEAQIEWRKNSTVSAMTDEKDITREKARIWDAVISNDDEFICISFVNIKSAFPDIADVTEDVMLDQYKDTVNKTLSANGGSAQWEDRTKVKLGGEEFTRDVILYSSASHEYLYVRKLGDDLLCFLDIAVIDDKKTPDYYEAMFE